MEGVARPSGTVTFLFTDIEGSTALWEQQPDAMRAALAKHDELVRAVLEEHGGYVFAAGGDGFGAAFSAPTAAVRAALAVQAALGGERWRGPLTLLVRMGLHTGTADERDGDYFGSTPSRAARIMALAHGGEVVVSAATAELSRDLSRSGVELVDLGRHQLRGLGPEHLFGVAEAGQAGAFRIGRPELGASERLPRQASSFIGRELDLVELQATLASARLVTLVGPGGVGKTRLAIETAWIVLERYDDGVWLSELAQVRDPDALAHALVAAMEVRPLPGRSPLEALVAGLVGQRRLVIVDNCEHVLSAAAAAVRLVVEHCPTVTVLATSRAPLGVPGERTCPLMPLPAASAGAELFCDRAAAADSHFFVGDRREVIESLCRRLDGMPLAIELAAARVRAMSPTDLLARLDDRFRLLKSHGGSEGDPRHATLQATVEWSYRLLDERTQIVFDRLGVFAAAVDLDAVVAVAGDNDQDAFDVLDALTTLVDHSLVVTELTRATTRYRLLETMRAFARDRLNTRDDLASTSRAHGEWAADRVETLLAQVTGPDEPLAMSALDALEDFWPDLRTAVHHAVSIADTDLAARLVGGFGVESLLRERDEVAAWVNLVTAIPGLSQHARARDILGVGAFLDWRAGRYDEMNRKIDAGIVLGGEEPECGVFDMVTINVTGMTGAPETAKRMVERVVERTQGRGDDDFDRGFAMIYLGLWFCFVGAPDEALRILDTNPRFRNPVLQALHRWARATALVDLDPSAAITAAREASTFAASVRASWIAATATNYLAAALAQAGEPSEAIDAMQTVVTHAATRGAVQSLSNTVRNGITLFGRLGLHNTVAVLAGWLDNQRVAIPGTAGMRQRAAQFIAAVAHSMPADEMRTARARGASMTADQLVAFLQTELDGAANIIRQH